MKKNNSNGRQHNVMTSTAEKTKDQGKEKFAFYIGIDLGDKHCDVCVLNGEGEFEESFRLRMQGSDLQKHFVGIPRSRVAVEAGGQSRWVAELLEGCGHQVYVSNTRKVAYITQSDDKDDPGDAYKLAELVHFKPRLLHPIQHRSRQAQADLSWIRAREALVESRTQLVNTIRGLSKAFGEQLARCSVESFTAKLASLVPEAIRGAVAPLLETIDDLNERIRYYERFPKSRMVGCFLGMRPRKQESGQSQPQLGITKAGDGFLRKTLVNCAHHILGPKGKDSDLRRFGLRICARGGKNAKKRAVIAVARKLAVLLHRLWVTGEVYEPLRNSQAEVAA